MTGFLHSMTQWNVSRPRRLLAQMGVIQRFEDGRPLYDPQTVCLAPQERVFYRGSFLEGLGPEDDQVHHFTARGDGGAVLFGDIEIG